MPDNTDAPSSSPPPAASPWSSPSLATGLDPEFQNHYPTVSALTNPDSSTDGPSCGQPRSGSSPTLGSLFQLQEVPRSQSRFRHGALPNSMHVAHQEPCPPALITAQIGAHSSPRAGNWPLSINGSREEVTGHSPHPSRPTSVQICTSDAGQTVTLTVVGLHHPASPQTIDL